jgi:hypothetical protein
VKGDVFYLLIEAQAQLRHVTQQALHHDAAHHIIAQHSTCRSKGVNARYMQNKHVNYTALARFDSCSAAKGVTDNSMGCLQQ